MVPYQDKDEQQQQHQQQQQPQQQQQDPMHAMHAMQNQVRGVALVLISDGSSEHLAAVKGEKNQIAHLLSCKQIPSTDQNTF